MPFTEYNSKQSNFKEVTASDLLIEKYQKEQAPEKKVSRFKEVVGDIKETTQGIKDSLGKRKENIGEIRSSMQSGEQGDVRSIAQTAGQVAGGVSDILGEGTIGIAKLFTSQQQEDKVRETLSKKMEQLSLDEETKGEVVQKIIDKVSEKYNNLSEKNKRDVDAAGGLASLILDMAGGFGAKKAVTEGVDVVTDATKQIVKEVEPVTSFIKKETAPLFEGMAKKQAVKQAEKYLQSSIEAVNPDLSGKRLTEAYKNVVKGGRDTTPASMFQEQGLTPDQRTMNLGKRLQDIKFGKDNAENLDLLARELKKTEDKLEIALKGDSEIVYNLDKPTIVTKIDSLKVNKPGDFIGDNGKIYDNVIDFGKKTIQKSDDTIKGGRDARAVFDIEAKRKFPSAYKDGRVDTSTPAGHAIKEFRDALNTHIYEVAPNGSEIKQMIGREADIFQAAENIAPKAARLNGVNSIGKFAKNHPKLAKYLGYGLTAAGASGATVIIAN